MLDYHIHVAAHGEYKYTDKWVGDFLNHARLRKINEVGLLEHDEFLSLVDNGLIERLAFDNPDLLIRRGLEVDYVPGSEQDIKKMLAGQKLDYVIGSVHFIDGWGFDHPDNQAIFENKDIDQIYGDYFDLINQAVLSGLFDIIGHFDLVKIWGYRPIKKGIMHYVNPVLRSISKSDLVIEINSAGLRKPVNEIYPEGEILKAMFDLNIPVTLGSDAHHPDQVGEGLEEARSAAKKAGYRYISGFDRRQKHLTDL